MIARAGSGWQTVLADLALILFMVTAAALSQAPDDRSPPPGRPLSPQAEPLAWYTPEAGAPAIGDWLAAQSGDARQQLTIVSQYAGDGQARAVERAAALARAAGAAGAHARIVIEPGGSDGVTASLAYDDPRASLARGLRQAPADPLPGKDTP